MSDPKAKHQHPSPDTRLAESRRRLVQAGLASAPLFLALRTTPVLAANCKNPSGFSVSGNLSRPGDFTPCNFAGPTGWLALGVSNWPTGTHTGSNAAKVRDTLGTNTYIGSTNNTRLDAALGSTNFIKYMAAAYLNSVLGGGFPVTTTQVKAMWLDGPSGSYVPNPTYGSTWDEAEIVAYLQYLMAP